MHAVLDDLYKIKKEELNVDLVVAELKQEHSTIVEGILELILEDSEVDYVNEFTTMTNNYLAQLIQAGCSYKIRLLEEATDFIDGDARQLANHNQMKMIRQAFEIIDLKIHSLVQADESLNQYPLSREGVTVLKEYQKASLRLDDCTGKIKNFQRKKIVAA